MYNQEIKDLLSAGLELGCDGISNSSAVPLGISNEVLTPISACQRVFSCYNKADELTSQK